jgi:hypothetical protein
VRDWPETVSHGQEEEVLPPDLEHTAGHAVILDKKTCPGKEDENVFLVDAVERNFGYLGGGTDFHFDDPDTIKPEYKPKWLPQVMQRLQHVAEHDANAKEFVEVITAIQKDRSAKAQTAAAASSAPAANADSTASMPVAASASVSASETVMPTAQTN